MSELPSIESYLHQSDGFRATNAPFPFPYSLKFDAVPGDLLTTVRAMRTSIEDLIRQYGLPSDYNVPAAMMSKPGYPNVPHEPRLTIRIEYRGPTSQTFDLAKHRLAHSRPLNGFGIDEVDTEIVHLDHCFNPSLFPIPPSHPSVEVYESIQGTLMERLRTTIPSQWTMASLFLVGRYLEQSSPAIVIMVRPGSRCNWRELSLSIQNLIDQHNTGNPTMNMNVVFIPGVTSFAPMEANLSGADQTRSMDSNDALPLGKSIGIKNERELKGGGGGGGGGGL